MFKEEINPNVFWYTFQNKSGKMLVHKFYTGLSLAGKGYSLTALNDKKNRYYTICSTMGSALYP